MMYKSPSDGFTLEELRSEFDWMFEFQSRMAEHIRNDSDVHSLADYVGKLEAENAKLVDVLHEVEAEAVYAYHCLQQDCVTTANSSEHFFKKWWHTECECDRLKSENAKLRELVRDYEHCTVHADCSRCEYDGKLSTHCPFSPCFPDTDELRELGVEE